MLSWAKKVKVQRAQTAIMDSLTEVKEFDKLKVAINIHKEKPEKIHAYKIPTKQKCKYCGSSHPLR